jgi:anti-sigma-K factor RskA
VNDHDRDLIAGEALGGSSADESARVAELVAKDRAAASALEAHRATVTALESGVARAVPSDDLFARILADVAPAPASRRARPRRSWVPRLATVGVAVAAAVVALAVFTGGRGAPDAQAAVAGTTQFADVSGEAKLYGDELVLDLEHVPAPPSGHHYEVWVLRREGGGAMEAVGAFTPQGDEAKLELPLPGPGDYQAVDVSVEPDGGPAEHSSVSLASGSFGS